jgi:hypothetical protein
LFNTPYHTLCSHRKTHVNPIFPLDKSNPAAKSRQKTQATPELDLVKYNRPRKPKKHAPPTIITHCVRTP